jgi:thiamine pyrophosphate-dependent acetolactate synthase large subunit-like protein
MVLLVVQIETGSPEQRIGTCGDGGFMMHEQR